ncbi:MAG: hypothetical protein P8I78_01235, partial [Flavobacterium sp.]|nr:hypothetical protein [Flavobacterium sp.]
KVKPFGTFLLAFIMSLTFTNCQVEKETIKNQASIETISVLEAISFLRENNVTTSSQTGKSKR